jgi:hypothetical protein
MHKVKRLGVMSVAKVLGALYGAMAIIFVPIFLIMAAYGPQGTGFTAALAVLLPVFYAIGGFVGGAFMAWIYNLAAQFVGGIEVGVELTKPPGSDMGLL